MARIKKKGTSGAAKSYITRTQAVRKLQISLPDFRRLCIFKGIYPREPRNKKKASKSATPSTTFYYTKDVQYLLHEPLLQKFRDHKSLAKKIGRALGRGEAGDAARLERNLQPRITLDHIIKERYPTFVDALRDLDDALSMLFLFANLPSTSHIPPKTIALCQRLCLEFQHYLIVTNSLRKSFLSIKGIYYQATIQGQDILWLVPYKFVQHMSGDIDFRIMGTFVEFYTTLLGFVNFRLYTSIGLVYPPKYDANSDDKGAELGAFTLQGHAIDSAPAKKQIEESGSKTALNGKSKEMTAATERAQATADALKTPASDISSNDPNAVAVFDQNEEADTQGEPEADATIDTFPTSTSSDADILPQPAPGSNEAATLFAPFTFYLSRETPRQPLEFLLKAFGCKRVGWDAVLGDGAFTTNESDPTITHQVVDRPPVIPTSNDHNDATNGTADEMNDEAIHRQTSRGRVPGRTYIQPQWVWDSVNTGKLLRPDLYGPGAMLPPHLSPWVKPTLGAYDPTAPLEGDADFTSRADITLTTDRDDEEIDADASHEEDVEDDHDDDDDDDDDEDDDIDDVDGEFDVSAKESKSDGWAGFSSGSEEDASKEQDEDFDDEALQTQRELEAEASGKRTGNAILKSALRKPNQAQREAREKQEQLERQKMMMPARKRKLFEKMQYSNAKKDEEKERLVAKRRKIEGRERL